MALATKPLTIGGAVLGGGGGVAAGGTYLGTKESVERGMTVVLNKETNDKTWKKAERQFKKINEEEQGKLVEPFLALFKALKEEDTDKSLKNTCLDVYTWTYRSAFGENEKLIEQTKKYCAIARRLLEDEIEDDILPQTSEFDVHWEEKIKTTSTTGKPSPTLGSSDDKRTKISNLKQWCSKQYETEWGTGQSDLLTEVKKWCVYTVKEKLTKNSKTPITEESSSEKWTTKVHTLGSMVDSNPGLLEIPFMKELVEARKKHKSNQEQGKVFLKDWCAKTYNRGVTTETRQAFDNIALLCAEAPTSSSSTTAVTTSH